MYMCILAFIYCQLYECGHTVCVCLCVYVCIDTCVVFYALANSLFTSFCTAIHLIIAIKQQFVD